MEWPQSGPQSPRWIETNQFRGSWSLSETTAGVLAIVVALAICQGSFGAQPEHCGLHTAQTCSSISRRSPRRVVVSNNACTVAHMLEVSVTDPTGRNRRQGDFRHRGFDVKAHGAVGRASRLPAGRSGPSGRRRTGGYQALSSPTAAAFATIMEFPPSQRAASFGVDQIVEKMQKSLEARQN
jgi:hypothetical protein